MRPTTIPIAACLTVSATLLGCSTSPDAAAWHGHDASLQQSRSDDAIVDAAGLGDAIAAAGDDLVIFDVRPHADYTAGHLPGAVRIDDGDWSELSLAHETGLTHEQAWHARIGSFGVDADDTVLIYDAGSMTQAARVWFILQHFGAADARVINGGFPLIADAQTQGRVALTTEPTSPKPVTFRPHTDEAGRIGSLDRFEVKAAIEAGRAQVLDARTPDEFRGVDLRGNPRGGHLPTAINVSHTTLLDEQGRLKPARELALILEHAGFVRGTPVITHCQSGGRAALAALAAARAGYGPVVNYYLSFGDWSKDATCPVTTP